MLMMRGRRVPSATLVVIAALAARGAPAAAQPRATAIGFDHIVHDGRITVLGQPSIACATCHPINRSGGLIGRPGHATCLAPCHGPAPSAGVAPVAAQLEVCTTCHAEAALTTRRPAVAFPPYVNDLDYPLTISHAAHAAIGARCEGCHDPIRTAPAAGRAAASPPAHGRCSGCHDGTGAAAPMTACTNCHVAAYGANALPRLVRGPLAVGTTYSHAGHQSRTPAASVACASCHRGIAAAAGLELPPPTAASCSSAGCHDGVASFATSERCTNCHRAAPAAPYAVTRPTMRFSHDTHAGRLSIATCTACHGLDVRGQPSGGTHRACVGCHAADFGVAVPTICGACHTSTEAWRPLIADRLPPPTSEFGAHMNHAAHAAVACTRCHTLTTAARELRPPRGHGACTGTGCHAATGGPAPTLDGCAACHARGLERDRTKRRQAVPWSVAARFRHQVHATHGSGAPVPCTSCHDAVTSSTDAGTIASPSKSSCAPCHDGKVAFKISGHGCARCHGD